MLALHPHREGGIGANFVIDWIADQRLALPLT